VLLQRDVDAALQLLARMHIPSQQAPASLVPLFVRLLQVAEGQGGGVREEKEAGQDREHGAQNLQHHRVYSALIAQANPAACRLYEEARGGREGVASWVDDGTLVARMGQPELWGEFLLSAAHGSESSHHFLQHVIHMAVRLTTREEFALLGRLANLAILAPLRPLFLLVCWDVCEGKPQRAEQLLASLPVSSYTPAFDPLLSLACRQRWYQLHVAQWCHRHGGKPPPLSVAPREVEAASVASTATDTPVASTPSESTALDAAVFNAARDIGIGTTSALHLVRQYVNLGEADDAALVRLVQERPVVGSDGDSGATSGECQRNEEVMAARAFGAMKQVLQVIHTMALSPAALPADRRTAFVAMALDQAKQFINDLQPAALRLEILENVYSLLFLTREAWEGTLATATRESVQFLPSEEVTGELLALVRDCASVLQSGQGTTTTAAAPADEGGTSSPTTPHTGNFTPTMSPRELARLQRLVTYVHEVQWRLQLIRATDMMTDAGGSGESGHGITRHLLASPTTLLTACLRARDFDRALEVIKMFNIDNSTSRDAVFGQDLAAVAASLSQDADASEVTSVLDRLPALPALQCCLDLAATSASSRAACVQLLEKALTLIDTVKAGPLTGNEDTSSILALGPLLVQLKSGVDDAASSLSLLIATQHNPLDPAACRRSRECENKRRVAHQMLTEALRRRDKETAPRGRGGAAPQRNDAVVEAAMQELGRPPEVPAAGSTGAIVAARPYLQELFGQLTLLAQAEEETGGNTQAPGASATRSAALDALCEGPVETIARLVFEKGGCQGEDCAGGVGGWLGSWLLGWLGG